MPTDMTRRIKFNPFADQFKTFFLVDPHMIYNDGFHTGGF